MESRAATVHQRLLPVGVIVDRPCDSSRARRAVRNPTRGTPLQEQLLLSIWRGSTRSLRHQTDIQSMHWEPISLASSSFTSCARKNVAPITRVGGAAAAAADVASEPSAANAAEKPQQIQDVVIVGGGIAGLATALALHRLGVKSVLLEQSEQLRTAGSTIGIWTNAWRALEALGVADSLREKFAKLAGLEFYAADGNCLLSLGFQDAPRDVELRGVERKALLETLREPLPDGTVLYDSQVVGIRKLDGGYTEVECENGSTMQTKVLIGCDGTGSVVARWMDFKGPHYAGYTAIRGLAVFPDGHKMKNAAKQILGQGVRAGIIPMDSKRVYWFVVFNSPGERITDSELVRKEALNYVQGWPDIITDVINKSSLETLSRRGISDRWMWPVGGPPLYRGGVTLAGDAMHPMTPNLGQGGCCALEDAVVLGRALSKALSVRNVNGSHADHSHEMGRIELALKSYTEQRWRRMLPMAIRSYAIGALLQLDYELVCAARNKLLPKIFKLERFIDHTFYDCGTLS